MAVQCHVWHCTATFKKTKRVCKQNFSLSLKDAPAALPLFARTDETLVMLYSIITINLEIILYDCFILNPPKVLHLPTSFRIGTPDQPVIHFSSLAHLCPLVPYHMGRDTAQKNGQLTGTGGPNKWMTVHG